MRTTVAIIALLVVFIQGCATEPPKTHASLVQWELRTGTEPGFAPVVRSEVVYVVRAVLDYRSAHHGWPVTPGDLVPAPERTSRAGQFLLKNVELEGGSMPFKLIVWDLERTANHVTIAGPEDIGIYTEPFARGSRTLVHDSRPGASIYFDLLFRNL